MLIAGSSGSSGGLVGVTGGMTKCLQFCEGDYAFLLVSLVGDPRGRVRVNGWRAVHGIL